MSSHSFARVCPRGAVLWVGTESGSVFILDARLGLLGTFNAHGHRVLEVIWLEKRQLLITVGSEEPGCSSTTVKLWPAEKLLAAASALANGTARPAGAGAAAGAGAGAASATGTAPLAAAASGMTAAKVTKTGLAMEALQDRLPNARVLYSSATGASEPDNLRYMVRLGAFDCPHISDMINALKSRTLSYKGAEFITEELEPDPVLRVMYDRSCRLWGLLWNVMRQLPRAAAKNRGGRDSQGCAVLVRAPALIPADAHRLQGEALRGAGGRALRRGMCVVMGLWSGGAAENVLYKVAVGALHLVRSGAHWRRLVMFDN
ncbi:hypothetical protein HXX76_012319 [Chlamydomonas incerta]|uniref:Strawberry notch AAA domain-containing protein n=1 Tax=Chlamydomonas incerta TaxID=51695 RepID=A0A835SW78_CHLIN|nr:hypothetical protein HXX76_012319 [Chlamydomonas incerta]|eukprot:KAG2427670.1 hypothetical protein HXX76_012319 [Chlamydomonas incerta]